MTDWLLPALAVLPTLLGTFLAIGVPWALVILPRRDWHDRVLVAAVALALGPMLLTAAMFLLGTFLRITLAGTLLAGAILALWGALLAWLRTTRTDSVEAPSRPLLDWWERLIVVGLALAALIRVIHVAYWPFTTYDALWVYGYNGRVFTLTGQIPADMGYYPQLLPLSYTFAQMAWGAVNDHAARMAIPIFALGSILAAYVLGARLFSRRVGLLTAAFWTLYPHHALWAQFGDLEVPLTFYFTLAAALFLLAWRADEGRWRYAALSGLLLGGALWTKPTAGALVWGIGLALLIEAIRIRFDWARLWPRIQLALVVGLAAAPIGGMWYLRNLLLGHPALVFPPSIWLARAQRSGQELGWPLLTLAVLAFYLLLEPKARRPDWRPLLGGTALMVLGALPSAGFWAGTATHRLRLEEIAVMLVGLGLYILAVWRRDHGTRMKADKTDSHGLHHHDESVKNRQNPCHPCTIIALYAPYFVTWFYSYSYHPRLAFAITPLQLVLIAALVVAILPRLTAPVRPSRQAWMGAVALLVLILPGLGLTVSATVPHLLAGDLPDDDAKHRVSNWAMYSVVEALREAEAQGPLYVVAPGALRLPFFFPEATIITDPVTDLHALDDRATHYVAGLEADEVHRAAGTLDSPARAVIGLPRFGQSVRATADNDFWYEVYEVNTALRWVHPFIHVRPRQEAIYPGFAELLSYAISANTFWPGQDVYLTVHWRVLGHTDGDYTVFLHLTDGERVYAWDHIPGNGLYHTNFWEPGEYVTDEFRVTVGDDILPGTYQITAGLYDFASGERLPVTLDGVPGGESVVLIDEVTVLAGPPE